MFTVVQVHEYDKQHKSNSKNQSATTQSSIQHHSDNDAKHSTIAPVKSTSNSNQAVTLRHLVKNNRFWNLTLDTYSDIPNHHTVVQRDGILGKLNVHKTTESIAVDTVHEYIHQCVAKKLKQGYREEVSSPAKSRTTTVVNVEKDPDLPSDVDKNLKSATREQIEFVSQIEN